MKIKILIALALTSSVILAGCSDVKEETNKNKGDGGQPQTNADYIDHPYAGKWRYVDNGQEFNIGLKNFGNIYFLDNASQKAEAAPEEFTKSNHYIFAKSSTNILVQKRKGDTDRYLVRDGILDTHVTGSVVKANQGKQAMALASSLNNAGGAKSIFKNKKTDDVRNVDINSSGTLDTKNIPTGEYDVTIQAGNDTFKATLPVQGAETDLGLLNITTDDSLNFKVTAVINSKYYREGYGSSSAYSSVSSSSKPDGSDKTNFDFYRGQYLFPTGDLQSDSDTYDPYWIEITIRNISTNHAEGVSYKILCDEAEWILECGGGELVDIPGTIGPDKTYTINHWIKIKPFNSEKRTITLPIQIRNAAETWEDELVFTAYKKAHIIKVSQEKSNRSFIFLPGRQSLSATNTTQYFSLPYIKGFTYDLLFSNNNGNNQATYSIANGANLMPLVSTELTQGRQNDWNLINEPENNSELSAPIVDAGEVKNAFLHKGDLDFYKLSVPNNLSITANGTTEQNILADKSITAGEFLSFTAKDSNNGQLTWSQVRGPKVDFSQDNGKFEITIPQFSRDESLVFKVTATYDGTYYAPYDYLAINIKNSKDFTVVKNIADKLTENIIFDDDSANVELAYTAQNTSYGSPVPSNTLIVDKDITFDSVILQPGTKLIVTSGILEIREGISWVGATIEIQQGAKLILPGSSAVIPNGATLILDGTLEELDNLIIKGTITYSEDNFNGLKIYTSSSLIIEKDGILNAGELGYKGVRSGNWADRNAPIIRYHPESESFIEEDQYNYSYMLSGFHGGEGKGNAAEQDDLPFVIYGNKKAPTLPGLGGFAKTSSLGGNGNGGGVVHIKTSHLVLNGSILANGGESYYAGGAGGSVWIDLNTGGKFESKGLIDISGGSATYAGYYHGGGGRLAITGCSDCTQVNKKDWKGFNESDNGQDYEYAPNNGTFYLGEN